MPWVIDRTGHIDSYNKNSNMGRKHPSFMKGMIMAQAQMERPQSTRLFVKFGATAALAILLNTPLQAQETVVQGKVQRSDIIQERVAYADLNLREQPNQLILVSRVKKAANRVCNIIYQGEPPMEVFQSGCRRKTYSDAKPQIELAIANAQNGKQIAMSFVVARSH